MYDRNCKFDESAIIKLKNCPTSALTTISTNAENGAAWTRSTTLIADETSFEMLDDLTTDVSCTERASIRSSRKDSRIMDGPNWPVNQWTGIFNKVRRLACRLLFRLRGCWALKWSERFRTVDSNLATVFQLDGSFDMTGRGQ